MATDPHRRAALRAALVLGLSAGAAKARAQTAASGGPTVTARDGVPDGAARWSAIEREARGQTVRFNAWAGSDRVNAYLQWAAAQLAPRGVRLQHVKIAETAEAVQRLLAERDAQRRAGSIDLLWINGENFLRLKRERLLHGPFAEQLPSWRWVDTVGKPTTRVDFGEPVEGYEAPWGMAQLTFFADRRRVPDPPRDAAGLLALAQANPGRLTYPKPPDFHGATFLKQLLRELTPEPAVLDRPLDAARFEAATAPLWTWLDRFHPLAWRQGRQFPPTAAAMRQSLADGELAMALSFNPNEAASEILAGRLPPTVHSWQHAAGTIGNTHFLAIPVNAPARAGAQVVVDFLMSPAAQARKADLAVWGDPTVLDLARLPADDRRAFDGAMRAPGAVPVPAPVLPEPHASWVEPIERAWTRRYGV